MSALLKRTTLISFILWAGSLFLPLAEYESRGVLVRIYGYSFYDWLPVLLKDSHRVPANLLTLFLLIDLLHIGFCFGIVLLVLCVRADAAGERREKREIEAGRQMNQVP